MEPWIFMFVLVQCFWHFASRLESQRIFSTFCRLEKEATGPEQGLYTLSWTHTHAKTHVSIPACALGWPHHIDACTCVNSGMPCVNYSSVFFSTHKMSFWLVAVSSAVVDICVLIMSLHLWLPMFCLHEMCVCWWKTMSATMTRWRGLVLECNEYINSVQTSGPLCERVSRRAECYSTPAPLQGNEWSRYT